jgi:ABC-type protease/lipase transport system fused ATPase/permease subunit
MIMREQITAEWAKKTAESILGEKVNGQINICLDAITKAVNKNIFQTSVSMYAHLLVIKELNKRGFSVKQYDDQKDGPSLVISWYE